MRDKGAGDRATCFLLGAAFGAVAALLLAPASGARTRRRLARKGEEVADYLIDAGKELVEDATHELSGKYRALQEHAERLVDEADTILRRARSAATGR